MTAWNIPLLEGEEPTRYGPKEPAKATNAGPLRARGAQPEGMNSDAGRVWAPGERMPLNPIGAPPLDWWNLPWEQVRDRLIRAMCPEKVCRECGEPSRRIVEKTSEYEAFSQSRPLAVRTAALEARGAVSGAGPFEHHNDRGARGQLYETLGFSDCGHNNWRPGAVIELRGEE